ncbi:MAG: hypothetical protein DWQ49_09555 [Bacteroidetes bacterium]|nr:MAG: hypothetical protein DWQ49_09555 [Bacteroidota bacterium]
MAIADDISVATNGNIRWTGSSSTYTVLEFHRFLQDLADDAVASGDDLLDITSDTPSDRSTDNIISLLGSYNIDDEVSEHLYDGSISQNSGDDVYSGLVVVGSVESGTELQIIQDHKPLSPFWGTGLNPDSANNIIMQIMVKTRSGGADIDGKKLRVQARELGDTYAEFELTAGLGNSTAAVFTSSDLNNGTAEATIAGWTTIVNTEGFQLIDITGDGTDEEYYAQWDTGSQTINDVYERTKWIQKRGLSVDSNADTGSDFIVDNATITGQGQEFTASANAEKLVRAVFPLKVGAGTPTGTMVAELYDSDDAGTAAPTGAVLATSETIETSRLTNSYQDFTFVFNDNVTLTASQAYFIVIRHADGTAGDYVHVQGLATTGTHAGNRAEDNGGWTGDADDDLNFDVFGSPPIHSISGELFRGITHEIVYDTEASGPFTEDEILFWGTAVTYDNLSGSFTVGEYVTFDNAGTIVNGGKVLKDTGTVVTVALEDISGSTLADGYQITGLDSAATADINVTINDQDKAGGEGILLALDDNGSDGDFYIQLISGSAPVDNLAIEGRSSGATAAVNATVTSRTISPEFIGTSTGSNIIGAYGIAFDIDDVGASDQFFDLTNTLRQPPNNVTFTVTGLVDGEDRVLVGPRQAGVLDKDQLSLNTTLSAADESSVVATAAIPSETPAAGTIRVELDSGIYKRVRYSSFTGSTFTIIADQTFVDGDVTVGTDNVNITAHGFLVGDHVQLTNSGGALPAGLATATDYYIIRVDADNIKFANSVANAIAGTAVDITAAAGGGTHTVEAQARTFDSDNATSTNNIFISYIDNLADSATELSFTAVYTSDRDLFVRVRDGGSTPIKTFESPATFGNANASIAAIRTSDA